ncbi:hypothetical protein BFF78_13930 [Streptomyces fodineus]|uniref:Uncharacterized protein n=1 Tax=Streptomyces fodineus TaxID=1904616 RepID=A0A1D7Y8Q6_9ACTN|nr:hypothetical protein [Streptomyces fodineus]AOR32007.1 hypothetical protein BFF78_13930 [Streptomyces fodineus]
MVGSSHEALHRTLRILEWRGVSVSDSVRERVLACTDLDQLEVWAQRAVHATDATELFTAE